jgi:hypothetical protein
MGSGQWGTQAFNGTSAFYAENSQLRPAFRLSDGIPPLPRTYPNLNADSVNGQYADLFEPTGGLSVSESFSVSAQRQLPGAIVFTASFSETRARDVFIGEGAGANLNALPLSALAFRDELYNEEFARSLRPYPHYRGFNVNGAWPKGRYQRDGGSLRLEKRASQGLVISLDYGFSKQMDDYSGPGVQDLQNPRNEWSLNAWNSPHRLSMLCSYELPIGSNKGFLSYQDWRRHLLDGWSMSSVSSFSTGQPLSIRPQFNNTGGVIPALRVNVVPGANPHVADQGPDGWFNPEAFQQPADFSLGNGSRTHPTLRAPSYQNHDVSLNKRFALAGERSMEFNAVGLNFLNHANWNDPDTTVGSAAAPNANAGKIIGSSGGRVVQLGLRLSF